MARLTAECEACSMSVDVPDNDFGRALVAAWQKEHANHDALDGEPS